MREIMPYRELDHTADILLEVTGASIHELFCEAARALMDILYPPRVPSSSVQRSHIVSLPIEVYIDTENEELHGSYALYELLLQAFLSEILFLTETEYLVFSSFDIMVKKSHVSGMGHGVLFDEMVHGGGIGVKGISYSDLAIRKKNDEYILTIIYDI
ncbi:MAG: archease [Methanomicrobiales archaeon]|nr:archease [Methanomicrobiales archaeon]